MIQIEQVTPIWIKPKKLMQKFVNPIIKKYDIDRNKFEIKGKINEIRKMYNNGNETILTLKLSEKIDKHFDMNFIQKIRNEITFNILMNLFKNLKIDINNEDFDIISIGNYRIKYIDDIYLINSSYTNIKQVFLLRDFYMRVKEILKWYIITKKNDNKKVYFYAMTDQDIESYCKKVLCKNYIYYTFEHREIDKKLIQIIDENNDIKDAAIEYNYYHDNDEDHKANYIFGCKNGKIIN